MALALLKLGHGFSKDVGGSPPTWWSLLALGLMDEREVMVMDDIVLFGSMTGAVRIKSEIARV